jgi:hypothetical protein
VKQRDGEDEGKHQRSAARVVEEEVADMVELTIKCTRAGRCNFLTKHSWAYSLQQCSSLSLRYV